MEISEAQPRADRVEYFICLVLLAFGMQIYNFDVLFKIIIIKYDNFSTINELIK